MATIECLFIFEFASDISYLTKGVYLIDQSEVGCKIISMSAIMIYSIRPYIMVAFSIDKLMSMRTNSIAILKKKWFQCSIVTGIVIFHIGLYICYSILVRRSEVLPGYFICDPNTLGFLQIFMYVFILESCIIPLVILITTSILTIRMLIKPRNSIDRTGNLSKDSKSRDRKFAISSLTFNAVYIFLQIPSVNFLTLFAFYSYYDKDLYYISIILFFLNCSLGFFIHIVTNSIFRREFLILFRFEKRNESMSSKTISQANIPIRLNQVSMFQ